MIQAPLLWEKILTEKNTSLAAPGALQHHLQHCEGGYP